MGRVTLEQRLIAARPDQTRDSMFVSRVMERIQGEPVIISSVMRKTSEQRNSRGGMFMNKLRALPLAATVAIIIGATMLTGVAAYTVYKTIIEPLTVEQTGSVIEDNKNKTTFALQGCPSYDGVSQAEITAVTDVNSGIGSEEARNYVIARCEQNAITKYAHDMVAARGALRYDSSVLSSWQPLVMPAQGTDILDVGFNSETRTITPSTEFYKDGKLVDRRAIPEGSLIHAAYGGVKAFVDGKAVNTTDVFVIMIATVDAKYYNDYKSGVYQRVPCHNNSLESCFSGIPGYTFYEAVSVHTGPVPAEEQHYADAIANDMYIELGGVIIYVDGSAFTFRTSSGRSVTFYLPEGELERARPPEHALPEVGTEIIITTMGDDRDVIDPSDLLSGYRPDLSK